MASANIVKAWRCMRIAWRFAAEFMVNATLKYLIYLLTLVLFIVNRGNMRKEWNFTMKRSILERSWISPNIQTLLPYTIILDQHMNCKENIQMQGKCMRRPLKYGWRFMDPITLILHVPITILALFISRSKMMRRHLKCMKNALNWDWSCLERSIWTLLLVKII